ncbi:MAG: FRG domain-containing protein [Desulfuromonadales bacterium]|nr:MAG: FRG domain-containing protein [Desulfuromonadales bacterium]
MSVKRFNESKPAESVSDLVAYLHDEHCDEFVYRGQTRSWPVPLLPSAFRIYKQSGEVFRRDEQLQLSSMRNTGTQFHGLEPLNHFWEFADRYCPSVRLSHVELSTINKLIDDPHFSLAICGATNFDCFSQSISAELDKRFSANYSAWKTIIDFTHRDRIRQFICLNPFGFVLGMAIAQHYGFSSEAIDVTHDPLVAAFFATHEHPKYVGTKDTGIGQIIRFRLTARECAHVLWEDKDFYSAESFADLLTMLHRFEDDWYTHYDSFIDLIDHVFIALEAGIEGRKGHLFRIGTQPISKTRVARQKGALLFPDMLLKEAHMAGMNIQQLMAVEDIGSRSGTETFFFRHSADGWPFPNITREYLWPQDDVFVDMFEYTLSSSSPIVFHPSGMSLPKRRDLLDYGYER